MSQTGYDPLPRAFRQRHYEEQVPHKVALQATLAALYKMEKTVFFAKEQKVSRKDWDLVQDHIVADYPELWFFEPGALKSVQDCIIQVNIVSQEPARILEMNAQLEKHLATLDRAELAKTDDPVAKQHYLLRFLKQTADYDRASQSPDVRNIVGCFVTRKCVCAGIVRGFKYLCDLSGIRCIHVRGIGEDEPHAWNMVQLDGNWYHFDPTWNLKSIEFPLFFNLDDAHDRKLHKVEQRFAVPKAAKMEKNFFQAKGLRITSNIDLHNQVKAILKKEMTADAKKVGIFMDFKEFGGKIAAHLSEQDLCMEIRYELKDQRNVKFDSVVGGVVAVFAIAPGKEIGFDFPAPAEAVKGRKYIVKCSSKDELWRRIDVYPRETFTFVVGSVCSSFTLK